MSTTDGENQRKEMSGHREFGEFKEGHGMERATKTTKVNMRLSERLVNTPVKLLAGFALGALVLTATVLSFGSTYADEPARPLTSEQILCYPEDNVVCLYGPFLFGSVVTTGAPIAGGHVSERIGCYPEDNVVCLYDQFLADVLAEPVLTAASRLSSEQRRLLQEYEIEWWEIMDYPWRIDAQGKVMETSPWQKFASRPNFSEQIGCYPEVDYSQCTRAEVESLAQFK
jgi:hypothetical protein